MLYNKETFFNKKKVLYTEHPVYPVLLPHTNRNEKI